MGPEEQRGTAREIANTLENMKASALEKARHHTTALAYASIIPIQANNHTNRRPSSSEHASGPLGEAYVGDATALQIKEELEQAFLIPSLSTTTIYEPDSSIHTAHLPSKSRKHSREEDPDESIGEMPVAVDQAQRPFAPAKKPKKDKKPLATLVDQIDSRMTKNPSEWYQQINLKQKFSRSDLQTLKSCVTAIRNCELDTVAGRDTEACFSRLRCRLHQMGVYDFVLGVLVKQSRVLEVNGLPAIFDDRAIVAYPWDIVDDSIALYQRWMAGVLDPHLLRGIDTKKTQSSSGKYTRSHNLQKGYLGKVSCNYVGQGKLKNGAWFPMQICAMRDGAHGEIEAGIHGQPGKGAYSIVLSGGGYSDIDEGDTVKYCGTSGSEGKPAAGTRHLLDAKDLGQPVRVLRSSNLSAKNIYRPAKGYRYDGLYDIAESEILDVDTAMHRFLLKRCQGQNPIRYQGVEKRPTAEEQTEYEKIQRLMKSV